MSALPCPVADPFAAADQVYATITEFLRSEEARQVKHSELERQLEGMGRELLRKLLQAHLDMRQPGKAIEPVRDAAGTALTPTPVHGRSLESIFGTVEVARTGSIAWPGWRRSRCACSNFRINSRPIPSNCRSSSLCFTCHASSERRNSVMVA